MSTDSPANLTIQKLLSSKVTQKAATWLAEQEQSLMAEHIKICEIPAPTFAETARGQYIYQRFQELNLKDVHIDAQGNVLGCWPNSSASYVCLSAHLDTVFPLSTNCEVKQQENRYYAPGISDNACGLVGLLAIARLFSELAIETQIPLLFVATVGEEGLGDLCGVRHLFLTGNYKDRINYFISFDGPGIERITHEALGSQRYQITLKGPGGHSWGDFGIVNPIHALGRTIAKMAHYHAPNTPRTSYNIGTIEGGSSVNSIAQTAQMQIDLRSVSQTELNRLETYLFKVLEEARQEEEQASRIISTPLTYEIKLIGQRPSGKLSIDNYLVQTALAATQALGVKPFLDCASTDANIPISLGLPGITIGAGGNYGGCHTLEEWYEPTNRSLSLQRALLILLALAGLK